MILQKIQNLVFNEHILSEFFVKNSKIALNNWEQ